MLVLLPVTAIHSYQDYNLTAVIGMSIFVISLFLMFLSSSIYHSMPYASTHKYILRIIDHSMIYIAIAGSYTPVALSLVGGWLGYLIVGLQWGLTIFGILYKIFAKKSMKNSAFSSISLWAGWWSLSCQPFCKRLEWHLAFSCWLVDYLILLEPSSMPRKALLPHDLASLYPTGFGTSVYRHCLLYVIRKQLLVT